MNVATRTSSVSMIRLVMSREIQQRIRSKGFAIFTALLCVGIIGIGVLNPCSDDDADVQLRHRRPAAERSTTMLDRLRRSGRSSSRTIASRAKRSAVSDGDIDIVLDADRER